VGAAGRACRARHRTGRHDLPPWAGLPELRIAIAAYLQLSRGIDCTPSQVFVTSGYRNSMELAARALLQPDDQVWVEDPWLSAHGRTAARAAHLQPVPVAVDGEGLMVAHGIASAPRACRHRHARPIRARCALRSRCHAGQPCWTGPRKPLPG
jgi:GntR family transcriptional regulator/MocR family aminotransferase